MAVRLSRSGGYPDRACTPCWGSIYSTSAIKPSPTPIIIIDGPQLNDCGSRGCGRRRRRGSARPGPDAPATLYDEPCTVGEQSIIVFFIPGRWHRSAVRRLAAGVVVANIALQGKGGPWPLILVAMKPATMIWEDGGECRGSVKRESCRRDPRVSACRCPGG
jgi:hypothetical protein